MKGGRIPVFANNFFAFNGSYNIIFKENYIYKTPVQDAPTIVLDNQTFDYRESQPGEIETANANYEKEQTYHTNFKDCEVLKNDNAEIVLDCISIFDKLESDFRFTQKYGNLGMDSIFKNILNCRESNTEEHLEFIKSLSKIFKISKPAGESNYDVADLSSKYNLFSKYSFIDELKTLITILMSDVINEKQIESMLLGNRIHGGTPEEIPKETVFKRLNTMLTNRIHNATPRRVQKSQTRYETSEKNKMTPEKQRFINICDFMRVTNIYTEEKKISTLHKVSGNKFSVSEENFKSMSYEEYITKTYETHIKNKTNMREYNEYMDNEIKEILDLKKNVFDYLKKTPLHFKFNVSDYYDEDDDNGVRTRHRDVVSLTHKKYVKYRDPNIAKEIGIDLGSFIILYYIKMRFNSPVLTMNNRVRDVIGIDPLYPLYPMSKKLFIDTLIGKENIPIIENVQTEFNVNKYPKQTLYGIETKDFGKYSECAGRGLFEIVKFIALGEDNRFHSEYFPDKTLDNVKELFMKYNTFEKMGMNEADAFSEFMDIMNDKKEEFGLNYVRDKKYELKSVEMYSYLNYVFNGAKKNTNSMPQIKHRSPIEIKITFDKNYIILENPYIILKLIIRDGHTTTRYTSKINSEEIIINNVEFANNMYLRYLIFKQVNIGILNSKKITNMNSMFENSLQLIDNLSELDVSNVTTMSRLFYGCRWLNQPLCCVGNKKNGWNVSKVTNMSHMFYACTAFNQPLNGWNVSNVRYMDYMFSNCTAFNQPLNSWNVSNVINMHGMFSECTAFNQRLGYDDANPGWNVSNVTNMSHMFDRCTNFNQPLSFDTSNVIDMRYMFNGCTNFNQPLSFNTSNVINMHSMFNGCTNFNQPLDSWNVSNVKIMENMFYNCTTFNQPLNGWDVSNVIDMKKMFYGCTAFNQPLTNWKFNIVEKNYVWSKSFENANSMFVDTSFDESNLPTNLNAQLKKQMFNRFGGGKFTRKAKKRYNRTHKRT